MVTSFPWVRFRYGNRADAMGILQMPNFHMCRCPKKGLFFVFFGHRVLWHGSFSLPKDLVLKGRLTAALGQFSGRSWENWWPKLGLCLRILFAFSRLIIHTPALCLGQSWLVGGSLFIYPTEGIWILWLPYSPPLKGGRIITLVTGVYTFIYPTEGIFGIPGRKS